MPELVERRKYVRNSRALYTGDKGHYKTIFQVVVLVETLIDGGLDEWTTYIGYCPENMPIEQQIQTVAEYGDKIYPGLGPEDPYNFFPEDRYPKELFRD